MAKPQSLIEKIKWIFWRYIVYPVFPLLRDMLTKLHIIRHAYRQPWHIGRIAPGISQEQFIEFLKTQGFANHFIAWHDSGEVVSLRRHDGFNYQYHLRIFNDGEIRGHYEKTPEAHPFEHFNEETFQPRADKFKEWLGDWVVYDNEAGNIKSQSAPAASREVPYNG